MSYDRVTAYLVEAVKELKAQSDSKIASLEKKSSNLKKESGSLKEESASLKKENSLPKNRLASLEILEQRLAALERAQNGKIFGLR